MSLVMQDLLRRLLFAVLLLLPRRETIFLPVVALAFPIRTSSSLSLSSYPAERTRCLPIHRTISSFNSSRRHGRGFALSAQSDTNANDKQRDDYNDDAIFTEKENLLQQILDLTSSFEQVQKKIHSNGLLYKESLQRYESQVDELTTQIKELQHQQQLEEEEKRQIQSEQQAMHREMEDQLSILQHKLQEYEKETQEMTVLQTRVRDLEQELENATISFQQKLRTLEEENQQQQHLIQNNQQVDLETATRQWKERFQKKEAEIVSLQSQYAQQLKEALQQQEQMYQRDMKKNEEEQKNKYMRLQSDFNEQVTLGSKTLANLEQVQTQLQQRQQDQQQQVETTVKLQRQLQEREEQIKILQQLLQTQSLELTTQQRQRHEQEKTSATSSSSSSQPLELLVEELENKHRRQLQMTIDEWTQKYNALQDKTKRDIIQVRSNAIRERDVDNRKIENELRKREMTIVELNEQLEAYESDRNSLRKLLQLGMKRVGFLARLDRKRRSNRKTVGDDDNNSDERNQVNNVASST